MKDGGTAVTGGRQAARDADTTHAESVYPAPKPRHRPVHFGTQSRISIGVARSFSVAILSLLVLIGAAGIGQAESGSDSSELRGTLASFDGLRSGGGTPSSDGLCPLRYDLPGDIQRRIPAPADVGQLAVDQLSWKTFLALSAPAVGRRVNRNGDNSTQWDDWSSTVDLIQCNLDATNCVCPDGDCTVPGSHYYPPECQDIDDYQSYRVLGQLSKVDDSFLEAEEGAGGNPRGGLANAPLIDANGNFLRFEVLTSPVAYNFVVENQYYDAAVQEGLRRPIVFPCGEEDYTGGDPADPRIGAIIVKNAWMELSGHDGDRDDDDDYDRDDDDDYDRDDDDDYDRGDRRHGNYYRHGRSKDHHLYHTEDLLVYTPSYRSITGVASCEVKTMALVGEHIAHKTTKQPRWIWATFEHRLNAPDCTALPPDGNQGGAGPSKACPASVDKSYNFYPKSCSEDGSDPAACQTCNTAPVSNAPQPTDCTNPNISVDNIGWCLDLPPAEVAGTSKTCRQVAAEYYPQAARMNKACARRLGKKSVWSNYQLISSMYYNESATTCQTVPRPGMTFRFRQRPQVPIKGQGGKKNQFAPSRPYVANSSMETDVRSDCLGCHSGASVGGTKPGLDFMFWLQLEVPGGSNSLDVGNK